MKAPDEGGFEISEIASHHSAYSLRVSLTDCESLREKDRTPNTSGDEDREDKRDDQNADADHRQQELRISRCHIRRYRKQIA